MFTCINIYSLSHVCWLVGWLVGVSSDGSLRRLWISTSISFLLRYVMLISRILIERFDWCWNLFKVWIVYKESTWFGSILWAILLIVFGRYITLINLVHGLTSSWKHLLFCCLWLLEYDLAAWRRVCICLCNCSSWHLKRLLKILCTSCYSVIPSSMCVALLLWIHSFILLSSL